MIYLYLISTKYKEVFREATNKYNFIKNIFIIYAICFLGFKLSQHSTFIKNYAEDVVSKKYPFLLSSIFLYPILDIIIRLILQPIPYININIYKTLPIETKKISKFILFSELITLFNLIYSIYILIFLYTANINMNTLQFSYLILIFIHNNYFVLFIKRKHKNWSYILIVFLYLLSTTFNLNSINIVEPYYFLIIISSFIFFYKKNINVIKNIFHTEHNQYFKSNLSNQNNISLKTHTPILHLMFLELKLIIRNKRAKQYFTMNLFLFLFLCYFFNEAIITQNITITHITIWILLNGFIGTSYQQLMFGWDSQHFDFILSNTTSHLFLKSKIGIFQISCIINFILFLPFGFVSSAAIYMNITALLFNIGFTSNLLILFSCYNYSKITLSKSTFFNYEGINLKQIIELFIIISLPVSIFFSFSLLEKNISTHSIGLCSIVSIFFKKKWLNLLKKTFNLQKYILLERFRQRTFE